MHRCTRRLLAPVAFLFPVILCGFAPGVCASALPRLAAALDLSQIASASVVSGSGATALVDEMMLAVPTRTVLPASVELLGPTTEVRIGLAHESDMNIVVTNEIGAEVCTAQVHMPAGWQKIGFSGRGADGRPLPNGVYFYRVSVDDDVMVTRVVINR